MVEGKENYKFDLGVKELTHLLKPTYRVIPCTGAGTQSL